MRSTNTEIAGDDNDGRMKLLVRKMDRTKEKINEGGGESAALALLLVSRFWLSFWWSRRVAGQGGWGWGESCGKGGRRRRTGGNL